MCVKGESFILYDPPVALNDEQQTEARKSRD